MKVDPNTAAYRLSLTGRTEKAILSPCMKINEKYKVDVQNVAPPFDKLVVDAWTTEENGEKEFHFEDGNLGHLVSIPWEDAKKLTLSPYEN